LAINRSTYEGLSKKLQEIQLSENQTVGNARILSPALPPTSPIPSRLISNLSSGAAIGAVVAISIALLLNSRDTLIRTSDEVNRILGYTILGILPNFGNTEMRRLPAFVRKNPKSVYSRVYQKIQSSKAYHNVRSGMVSFKTAFLNAVIEPQTTNLAVFVRDNPRSPISEGYRMLQTSLRFLSSDRQIKTIVVTSCIPEEGKSTVSANLAVAIAQLGKTVLLVDADMRRPSQHKIWEIPTTLGLSNILVGETTLEYALHTAIPNLDILVTGVIPPDPLNLINSQHMTNLISEWSEIYDYVIIDSPPLLAVADAFVLGKIADGVLMVARPQLLNSVGALRAKSLLEQSEINVLGLVINDVAPVDANYYMYNYYYTDQPVVST
jgi:polysaccharide biosynthesis transport protein